MSNKPLRSVVSAVLVGMILLLAMAACAPAATPVASCRGPNCRCQGDRSSQAHGGSQTGYDQRSCSNCRTCGNRSTGRSSRCEARRTGRHGRQPPELEGRNRAQHLARHWR